jgi:hypothetical protein
VQTGENLTPQNHIFLNKKPLKLYIFINSLTEAVQGKGRTREIAELPSRKFRFELYQLPEPYRLQLANLLQPVFE